MFLEQIERRQRALLEKVKNMPTHEIPTKVVNAVDNGVPRYKTKDAHNGARLQEATPGKKGTTVAITADRNLYELLQQVQRRYKTRGVRGALILAARRGIDELLRRP